jgi:HEPN domain-containing protein
MKTLPLEHYSQWPFARKAVIFLNAAKTANEITNRTVGSEEVSYYLLSHSVELAIKAVAHLKTGQMPPRTHDKQELAELFKDECDLTEAELSTIRELKELNNGPGGLRYENEPQAEFLPSTFNAGVKVAEKLLENFD